MKNLNHKQRALLYTIDRLHERDLSSRLMITKSLFLSSHVEKIDKLMKFYHFFPHHYGPFSNVCYTDISTLQKEGYIIEKEKKIELTEKGKVALKGIDQKATLKINRVVRKFDSEKEIMEYVYRKFPDYTIRSKLLPPQKNVRKNPFSMKFDFTKNSLKNYLENSEIRYLHIPELGIEGEKRKDLLTLKDYKKLFEDYEKTTIKDNPKLLDNIVELGRSHRVALMCFEADVNMCHRGVIARNIVKKENVEVLNI